MMDRIAFESAAAAFRDGDFETARHEFLQAVVGDTGDTVDAHAMLGYLYQQGLGGAVDSRQAATHYRLAAEQGHSAAAWNLSVLLNSNGDFEAARLWCLRAAERWHSPALVPLARMLASGAGGPRDLVGAQQWLQRAAKLGARDAMTALGRLFDAGLDGDPDPHEARQWFERAARRGDPAAQFNLGLFLEQGRAGTIDESVAAGWYLRAASQGQAQAQYNLGLLYREGRGVETDQEQAYVWFALAALGGLAAAESMINRLTGELRLGALAVARARVSSFEVRAEVDPGAGPESASSK
jgi:TPR repeat protein